MRKLQSCKFIACRTVQGGSITIWVAQNQTCVVIKWIMSCGCKDHKGVALLIQEVTHSNKSAVVKNNNVILYWSARHREIRAPGQLQSSRTTDISQIRESRLERSWTTWKTAMSWECCSYLREGKVVDKAGVAMWLLYPGLSRAAIAKLGLMSTAGEGAAISVCLTTCGVLRLAACMVHQRFVCVRVCVSSGERDENKRSLQCQTIHM